MNASKRIVICLAGMHRSGTSLMASYLEKCGVSMGPVLVKAGIGNEKGHFEDRGLVDFHKSILKASNNFWIKTHTADTFNPNIIVKMSAEEKKQAQKIVDERRSRQVSWGFKDPRSALLLNIWDELIPEAKYIFVYRSPELVIDSLYRRKGDWLLYPLFWWAGGAWLRYNREILNFYKENSDKSLLINIGGFNQSPDDATAQLSKIFDIDFNCPYSAVYSPKDITSGQAKPGIFTQLNLFFLGKRLRALYGELESHALINEVGTVRERQLDEHR